MRGSSAAHLDRCGEASVRQRERVGVRASQAQEGHPGAHGFDVAHSDHRASHAHQAAEHAGSQSAQGGQRLKVVQPRGETPRGRYNRYTTQCNVKLDGVWDVVLGDAVDTLHSQGICRLQPVQSKTFLIPLRTQLNADLGK